MSFLNFIQTHIDDINNYVQPPIHWREGRFTKPVAKAESTNGDFAEVVKSLPVELSREDVVGFFREDLYKGFVATIMWGGISRFQAEEIALRNDRATSMPKLERLVALLRDSETDIERIGGAIATLRRGGENYFYGIGPSYFTNLLYFLAYDMDLHTRPLIYDGNMRPAHFALMPEAERNPFFYYAPVGGKVEYAGFTSFEDVYYDYCELMCDTAREIGADVKNLEAWVFGWQAFAKTEVDRMSAAGIIKHCFGIEDLGDAIGASRIFYDNNIDVTESLNSELPIGYDEDHPIVIIETDGYVHLEYVITDILFRLKNLESKMISQRFNMVGDKKLDQLCFEVKSARDKKLREVNVYFDITAGYDAMAF